MAIILITSLILISNFSFTQNYSLEVEKNKAIEQEGSIKTKRSPFSFGLSPFVYIGINDYDNGGLGFGLELMSLYELNKNFNVGGFAKVKGIFSQGGPIIPGEGYEGEKIVENGAGSIGGIVEYKIFDKIGFNFRFGYENVLTKEESENYDYDPYTYETTITKVTVNNDPGFIYGGGVSLYTKRKAPHKVTHSFNLGVIFESNNSTTIDMIDIGNNTYKKTKINAFYIHFGWRMMLHGIKDGKNSIKTVN